MRFNRFMAILVFLIALTGCSRDSRNPVSSDPSIGELKSALENNQVISSDEHTAIGLFGIYQLEISKDKLTASLIPIRSGSIGESFLLNGGAYFTLNPCVDCLRIDNIGLDNENNIILGFSIKHPFQKGNPLEPPSPTNRLDLDIFDVALLMQPLNSTPQHYVFTNQDAFTNIVLNADGYTSELSRIINNHTLLPYKICYERLENNRFEMGTPFSDFNVVLNPSERSFILYITMAYGNSSRMMTRLEPQYYIPEFNRKAAWRVVVTPPNDDEPPQIGNTWDNWDTTTKYDVTIDIYDWNHGKVVDDNFPDPIHPDYLSASSGIESVTIEIPGMTSNVVEAETSDNQTNGWDDPITYIASIANENRLASGEYIGLVKVLDSRVPNISNHFGAPDTIVSTPDGVQLQWAIIPEFATYQTFKATVMRIYDDCGPITGSIKSPSTPITGLYNGQKIDFVVSASSANNGDPIVLYEADWDYDGTTFQADASNVNGIFNDAGPFTNPNCGGSNEPYTLTVAFRATDSCIPSNHTVFALCEVTVHYCCGPVFGEIVSPDIPVMGLYDGQTVDFEVCAQSPNGGEPIVLYQADFDYDGLVFDVDETNTDGLFSDVVFHNPNCSGNNEPITYTIAFRAMDQCNPSNVMIFAMTEVTVAFCLNSNGWARTWGGPEDDFCYDIVIDNKDDVYVMGVFSGTVDFDPGPDEYLLTTIGGENSYISKFKFDGTFRWAYSWGNSDIECSRIYFDNEGNFYVMGSFSGMVDFNPTSKVDFHTGTDDVFLSKYDMKFNYLWTKTWGGTDLCESGDIQVSQSGNIYIRGRFHGATDFDPGPGVDEHIPSGSNDYILNLNSNGDYNWVLIYQSDKECIIRGMNLDNNDNLVLTGSFRSTVDFDPGSGIHELTPLEPDHAESYLTKIDANKNLIWAISTYQAYGHNISINNLNQLIVAGGFSGTIDFDPGTGIELRTSFDDSGDLYICTYNQNAEFIRVLTFGYDGTDEVTTLTIDCANNIIATHYNWADSRWRISKLNSYSEHQWTRNWYRLLERNARADSFGNIYIVGNFWWSEDFDPGPGEDIHYGYGMQDAALVKILPNGLWE